MKAVSNFFKSVSKSSSKIMGGASLRGRRAFNAYDSQDYEAMVHVLATMTPAQFLREVQQRDVGLLHRCALDHNIDAISALSALPYFSDIVNDDGNEKGWTPMLCACIMSNVSDLAVIKLLVENGASLTQ